MKTNYYSLFAAAALLGLASCSSDEPNNGSNDGGLADGENYMAFTISNVGGNSRAASTNGSEEAVGQEGVVVADDVRFFFYTATGDAFNFAASENVNPGYTQNMVKPSSISQTVNSEGDVMDTGVLILGKAANQGYVGAVPNKVLCVANASDDVYNAIIGKKLSEALEVTTTWEALTSESKFMMTSATWVEDNEVIVADDNIEDHVATTPELAQEYPVTINLERLAAKVRAIYNGSNKVQREAGKYDFVVNGEEVRLNVDINGWQLVKTAGQSNAFKDLETTYDFTWTWNNPNYKRSYWAESNHGTISPKTYDIYADDQFQLQGWAQYNSTANIAYCYENTEDSYATPEGVKAEFDRKNDVNTAIVLKGTVNMYAEDGTTLKESAVNLCKWFGNYYTESRLKQMIVDSYNSANHTDYTATDVTWASNNNGDNSWKALVAGNETTNFGNILRWIGGVTSYYINIEHQGGKLGVVRNHIYEYVLDGVIGLGFPGNDDETPEDEETFVAAHLNILNWNVIQNHITLE